MQLVDEEQRLVRLMAAALIGALCLGVGGGVAVGFGAWSWASNAKNLEANAAAGAWLVGGATIGAAFIAPIGAVVGAIGTSRDLRRTLLVALPLVGLVLGLAAMASGAPSQGLAAVGWWPPSGALGGVLAAGMYRRFSPNGGA